MVVRSRHSTPSISDIGCPPGVVLHYSVKFPARLKHPSSSSPVCKKPSLFAERAVLTIWGHLRLSISVISRLFAPWRTRHIPSQMLTQVSRECFRSLECFPFVHKKETKTSRLFSLILSVQDVSLLLTRYSNCHVSHTSLLH